LFVWHKSIGMVILTLVAMRILWRLANVAPRLPADMPALERHAAPWGHSPVYLAVIALPVPGSVIHSPPGVPLRILWLVPLAPIVEPDEATTALAAAAHFWLFVLLAALLFVHVAAALRHHFTKRNRVLVRMLTGAGEGA